MAWWERWFGAEYLDLYPHRDDETARRETAFVVSKLAPAPHPLLDLCCGAGQHLPYLRELGVEPIGLDYSALLLERARARVADARLVRGDMRVLPFSDGAFASVVNLFTSFGYFAADAENVRVLCEIRRVLARGGRALCDTFGLAHVLARLVPEERLEADGADYRIRRRFDAESRRFEKEIEVRRGGETAIFRESVRAYTAPELSRLFEEAGLRVEASWGDFDGSAADPDAPRLILLASKP